jgi:GH25 family lysozyme M1 (1,4-beta-N-acetylmuramidase)
MSRVSRRQISVLAVAGVLASAASGGAMLAMSGGSGPAWATGAAAPASRALVTPAADVSASPRVPSRTARPSDPAGAVTPRPATSQARALGSASRTPASRPLPAATVKPPVVDGVRRTNVGSTHSPQLLQELSASPAATPPADAGARGVDVASYQHPRGAAINWRRVAQAGYKFAFIKATEGDYYVNPYYAADLAQAKAAGLYVTGYHFAVPNVSGGASQARYAVEHGSYAADGHILPLVLDIEYNPYGAECYGLTPARMVSWISAFSTEVRDLTGQPPIIYSTADWWRTCTGNSTASGADPLWVAGYGVSSPPMPAGWRNWTFWQYTSDGSVPGISGDVDVSYFNRAVVRLLDPGTQRAEAGTSIRLQVGSLNAASGQPPRFTAASLPAGLSISAHGLITGTLSAAAAGTHTVTVTGANSSGATGSVSFAWTVVGTRPTPSPQPSSSPTSPSASGSPTSPAISPVPSPVPSPDPSAPVSLAAVRDAVDAVDAEAVHLDQ